MTAAPPVEPAAATGATDARVETPRLRTTFRRRLFWIVVPIVAMLVAIATVLLTASGTPDVDRYSIGNAGPSGSRAVAEVLRGQGVDVVAAGSFAEARAAAGDDSTVLFTDPYGFLDAERLDAVAGLGTDLVLVEPGTDELDALAPGVANAGAAEQADSVAAGTGCAIPAAQRAGTISQPSWTYRVLEGEDDATTACFRSYDDAYAVVQEPRVNRGDSSTVTVLGAGDALTNEHVAEEGNAALVLGLLGAHHTLVWYMPGPDDLAGDDAAPTVGELTPGWVTPVILLLVLVTVAAGVWRGRRFGAVVVENLPVTVRASETMEGRARLYAKQGAYARALDALRIGTLARLTVLLALPRHATVVEVSRAVAAVTGRTVDEVHDTLVGALPRSEGELLALSDRLLVLEQDVHRATNLR
ncbi:DUF4350 domain-containing protein [Herbiconiux ginsengi]|uniref:DUF4350 domain-containing protein n=1 Tax=Herbiconiux ginsengi TaxID=381665 RepID=A0A1H3SVZ3_9MICO|nr:DUF4350 domain-containing protein [Herbiconiux ginsengi]SDZ41705.1 protein of unknown function [Herbiconiux ginsengi]